MTKSKNVRWDRFLVRNVIDVTMILFTWLMKNKPDVLMNPLPNFMNALNVEINLEYDFKFINFFI
jgi:hypothetical protein